MSYEVYFPECIETRLDGIEETAQYLKSGDFRAGWLACLQAVRASFGLAQTIVIIREKVITDERQLDGGTGGLG